MSFNEGKTIKDNHRIDLFMETSAKTGFHVEEMFLLVFVKNVVILQNDLFRL